MVCFSRLFQWASMEPTKYKLPVRFWKVMLCTCRLMFIETARKKQTIRFPGHVQSEVKIGVKG